jgi:hypothetical protein
MNQEPSVLDLLKARIRSGIRKILHPSLIVDRSKQSEVWLEIEEAKTPVPGVGRPKSREDTGKSGLPGSGLEQMLKGIVSHWRTFLALGLAIAAQISLEPHKGTPRHWIPGLILYLLAGAVLIWANRAHEWSFRAWEENSLPPSEDQVFIKSSAAFIASLVFSLMAFITFSSGTFTWYNLILLLLALITMFWAFWRPGMSLKGIVRQARQSLAKPKWEFKVDPWAVLILAAFAIVVFFRTYRLAEVPSQMVSDQAEKLLDISRIFQGKTYVFFQNNGGREFFQFYLTAAIILLFKTGLTYMSLKIGTVLAGLVTLYYIYMLGKEVGNRRVALLAMAFAGIAYWPNVLSRFGLRLPMYPLFYSAAIYYLIRGLRTKNRNLFALSGFFLGLGLNGYTAFRVVPFVILIAVGLYLLHKESKGYRRQTVWGLFALILISFIIFIPLLRFIIANPTGSLFRSLSRLGGIEQPLSAPAWQIFFSNFWKSLTMFSWGDGSTWPISVTDIPALDVISAALFHLGLVLLTIRYIRQKNWTDIFTLISIPVLMMPSILSLAFPAENPSMSRSAGAIIPVFLIVALALDGLMTLLESASVSVWSKRLAWLVGIILFVWSSVQNYDLVFNQYRDQYDRSAWNTTDLGQVVHGFVLAGGNPSNQWVVAYPYWVDSRLVVINAGMPTKDDAIQPEQLKDTVAIPGEKLFLLNVEDTSSLATLRSLYPQGWAIKYKSKFEGKDFIAFTAPPQTP